MENYVAFIMGIALLGMVVDLLCKDYPKLQRQIYPIFFVAIYFLVVIRYYYGPDIWIYVHHYEEIELPPYDWKTVFELGYEHFCYWLHKLGVSYWGMTAIITTLYFAALAFLFHGLPNFRLFAFSSVFLLDYNLVFAENRQCLAVAFFIFMVLCLQKKHYLFGLIFGAIAVTMHRSGFLPVGLTLLALTLYSQRQSAMTYNVLILILLFMMAIPVASIVNPLLPMLPFPSPIVASIKHHMLLGRQFQIVAFIYLLVLVWMSIYTSKKRTTYGWIAIEVLIGLVIIVTTYQYYFLLNRLRSYFLPFILFYLTSVSVKSIEEQTFRYAALIRQGAAVLLILFGMHSTFKYIQGARKLHAPIARACTLFDLRHASPEQIRDRQMNIALKYWREDYMKNENNRL